MTNTSVQSAESTVGSAGMWAVSLCPEGMTTLMPQAVRGHVKASQKTKALPLFENFPDTKIHDTSTPLRLRHHPIDDKF